MQLQRKHWTFVEGYLKTKTGIIIPTGSTGQRGPTGLIGTDALTAEMIGRGVGEKVGALVAPMSRLARPRTVRMDRSKKKRMCSGTALWYCTRRRRAAMSRP